MGREAAARALIGPEAELRPVGEGGERATWWVGTDRVLRLATTETGTQRQRRELRLRDALRSRLDVALPVSLAHGHWSLGLGYTLDTRLPGTSAERQPVAAQGEHDLAGMLTALRTAPALDLPIAPPRDLASLHTRAVEAARRLDHPEPSSVIEPAAAPVVLHHDLKGEHLLVTDDGRIAGVLDWTDAAVGDPAEDVAGLAIALGAPAALRVAARSGHTEASSRRALALARYDTLIRLAARCFGTDDSPLDLLRAQHDRAHTPTDLG